MSSILSVGIDIGTSTTQVIFSRLTLENESSFFSVPRVSIIEKEIIYKSKIYFTPFLTETTIDGDKIEDIVSNEFEKAGFSPSDTDTGAVIITGETARKENASIVLQKLSSYAGDFVVSTAGPDIESIIAGQGSKAKQYSIDNSCDVVNIDIGGGTSNIVYFSCGQVVSTACLDIGGRQIIVKDGVYDYISPSAQKIAKSVGIVVEKGETARESDIRKITDKMAELMWSLLYLGDNDNSLLTSIKTSGSGTYKLTSHPFYVSFSGGVADLIYNPKTTLYEFGDIGEALGYSIRYSKLFDEQKVIHSRETIRATVVGAGTYTTTLSGSTVSFTNNTLPIKNVPVLKLTLSEEQECFKGISTSLINKIKWFSAQSNSNYLAISMEGKHSPTFYELNNLSQCIVDSVNETFDEGQPLILIIKNDMAKALGQSIKCKMNREKQFVCLDSIDASQGDYIDMGKPLMNNLVVPVVLKTLIFG